MSTGKSPSWKRVLGVLSDATSEQRAKVQEALQQTLRDGSLEIEFTIKEKNRKILALMDELQGRDATIRALRERVAKSEKALVATQNGARSQLKELLKQKQAMQERLMAFELGAPLAPSSAPSTEAQSQVQQLRAALERAHSEVRERQAQAEAASTELRTVRAQLEGAEREHAGQAAEWQNSMARGLQQLKALQADKADLTAQLEALRSSAQGSPFPLLDGFAPQPMQQPQPPQPPQQPQQPQQSQPQSGSVAVDLEVARARVAALEAEVRRGSSALAAAQAEMASRATEWEATKGRAISQLKALQAEKANLSAQLQAAAHGALGAGTDPRAEAAQARRERDGMAREREESRRRAEELQDELAQLRASGGAEQAAADKAAAERASALEKRLAAEQHARALAEERASRWEHAAQAAQREARDRSEAAVDELQHATLALAAAERRAAAADEKTAAALVRAMEAEGRAAALVPVQASETNEDEEARTTQAAQALSFARADLAACREQLEARSAELEDCRRALDEAIATAEARRRQRENAEAELETANTELGCVRAELVESRGQLAASEVARGEREAKLSSSEQLIEKMRVVGREQVEKLKRELEWTRAQLRVADEQLAANRTERESAADALADAAAGQAAKLAACQAELAACKGDLASAQAELSARQSELARAQHELERARRQLGESDVGRLQASLDQATAERDELREEQRLLLMEEQRAVDALAAAEARAGALERELAAFRQGADGARVGAAGGARGGAPLAEDDEIATELADEIAALKMSHAKQVKQLQAELRKALGSGGGGGGSGGGGAAGGGADAARQVMLAKEVEALQAEVWRLSSALTQAEGSSPRPGSSGMRGLEAGGGGAPSTSSEPFGGELAWEIAVLSSLAELRHSLLETGAALQEELDVLLADAAVSGGGAAANELRLRARGGRGSAETDPSDALARLFAEPDSADASEELRRLQETASALRGLQGRLSDAYRLGLARPPRWLLATWHCVAACSGAQKGSAALRARAPHTPRVALRSGQIGSRVQALLSRRRGYDKVASMTDYE